MKSFEQQRCLVFVPSAINSIRMTGWLEKNEIRTLRCWTLSDLRRLLHEARRLVGAVLIDQATAEADDAQAIVASECGQIPMLLLGVEDGRSTYSIAAGPSNEFAECVLSVLRTQPADSEPNDRE